MHVSATSALEPLYLAPLLSCVFVPNHTTIGVNQANGDSCFIDGFAIHGGVAAAHVAGDEAANRCAFYCDSLRFEPPTAVPSPWACTS